MMPSESETEGQTPSGYGSRSLGKGGSMVKPPKKSEAPNESPKGYSAKGSKDEGKITRGNPEEKASESPADAPEGYNDMDVPHTHVPGIAKAQEGSDVIMHVYGKVKAHNTASGKNHSTVSVHKIKMEGDEDQSPSKAPSSANAAKMPMDTLKGILMSGQGNEGKQQSRYGNKDNTPYAGY